MADEKAQTEKPKGRALHIIRNVYLYLVTLIGLVTFIFGSVGIINNVLQHYVFQVDQSDMYAQPIYPGFKGQCAQPYVDTTDPQGKRMITPTTQEIDDCRGAEKEQNERVNRANFGRELSISLAQIAIGLPIWLFHWGIIQKDARKREDEKDN